MPDENRPYLRIHQGEIASATVRMASVGASAAARKKLQSVYYRISDTNWYQCGYSK
jgi:hypothetical protein